MCYAGQLRVAGCDHRGWGHPLGDVYWGANCWGHPPAAVRLVPIRREIRLGHLPGGHPLLAVCRWLATVDGQSCYGGLWGCALIEAGALGFAVAGVVRVFLGGGVSRGKGGGAGGRMLGSVLPNGTSVDWVRVGVMSTGLVAA